MAFVVALALCLAAGPWAVGRLSALSMIQPMRYADCPPLQVQQAKKHGTPTMGGLLVLAAATAAVLACDGFRGREGWIIMGAATGC